MYPGSPLATRLGRFAGWAHETNWREIPDSAEFIEIGESVSSTPIWLTDPNPFQNHPFAENFETALPERVEVVVIGAVLVGAAAAYHWSQEGREPLILLERNDPARPAPLDEMRVSSSWAGTTPWSTAPCWTTCGG